LSFSQHFTTVGIIDLTTYDKFSNLYLVVGVQGQVEEFIIIFKNTKTNIIL